MAEDQDKGQGGLSRAARLRALARERGHDVPDEPYDGYHYDFDAANERDLDEVDIAARNWLREEELRYEELRAEEELREAEAREWRDACRRLRDWLGRWSIPNPRRPQSPGPRRHPGIVGACLCAPNWSMVTDVQSRICEFRSPTAATFAAATACRASISTKSTATCRARRS